MSYDLRAPNYEQYTKWTNDAALMDAIYSASNWASDSAVCLDLCGGTGMLAHELKSKGVGGKWYNLDHSAAMLDRTPSGIEKILSSAESIPLPDNHLDFIVLRSALDYLDIKKVLPEVSRVLNEEGRFLVIQKSSDAFAKCTSWLSRMQGFRNSAKTAPVSSETIQNSLEKARYRTLDHQIILVHQTYDLNDWISRAGTIPEDRQTAIRELLAGTPEFLLQDLGLVVSETEFSYLTSWSVILSTFSEEISADCKLVASALPLRDRNGDLEFFIQKRFTEKKYWGFWELPQGHVDLGEDFASAAVRELREETGMTGKFTIEKFTGKWPSLTQRSYYFSRKDRSDFCSVLIPLMVEGEPTLTAYNRDYRWVGESEIAKLLENEDVYPPNRLMLSDYFQYNL